MHSWTRVIVEWANCLGIVDTIIESLQDLKDGAFYEKLVFQLCRGNEGNFPDTAITQEEQELVSKFVQAEYPDFGSVDCTSDIPGDLYTASLLLVQCSQQPMFHRPMCVALKHETQIRIKQFLEMVLPCGKNLTKESMATAIMELEDLTSSDASLTPIVRPLREFFNSPAVKSARSQRFMNDRNRELMCLRAQLETEQFEKADLIEDLKIQNEKMCYLQKKLDEKTKELRELRLKPPTPQSCRKAKRPSDAEERYRREVESLETMNSELLSEIEKLRDERDEIARRLTSSERFNLAIREKYEQSEKTVECLTNQLETRNNEILDLRMHSEELREHIRQMQRLSLGEQSFDAEPLCDEALSTIVDIQLQEARKEASQLSTELDEVKHKLEESQRECEKLRCLEITLRDRTTELDSLRSSLLALEKQLSSSGARVEQLDLENTQLTEKLTQLGACLRDKDDLVARAEVRKSQMESDLKIVNSRVNDLESLLVNKESEILELKSNVEIARRETKKLQSALTSAEEKLCLVTEEKKNVQLTLDAIVTKFEHMFTSLQQEESLAKRLEVMVTIFEDEAEHLRKKLNSSEEQILYLKEEKKIVEFNYETITKKLDTTESCLNEERTLVKDLKSTLVKANEEIEDMKKSIESKEKRLNDERTKVAELQMTISHGRSECESLQSMLDVLRITLSTEKEESDKLREIVSRMKKTSQDLEFLLRSKEELLEECARREISLNQELDSWRAKTNELESLIQCESSKSCEFESQLARAMKNCDELEAKLALKDNSLKKLEIEKKNLEIELNSANERIAEIMTNLDILRMNLATVEAEKSQTAVANVKLEEYAKAAEEKIVNAETKIVHYEQRIKDLDESLASKTEKLDKLKDELKKKNNTVDSLSQRLVTMEEHGVTMTNRLRTSENKIGELSEIRERIENQIARELEQSKILRHENESLKEEISNYIVSTKSLEQQISKGGIELYETQRKLIEQSSLREELAKSIEDSNTMCRKLKEELILKEDDYAIVISERDSFKEKLESSVRELSLVRLTIEKLEQEIESSNDCLKKELFKCAGLETQLQNLRRRNGDLDDELRAKNNALAELLRKKDCIEEKLASSIDRASTLEERIERAQQDLNESHENVTKEIATNVELREKFKDLQGTNRELEGKLATLQNQLTTVISERDTLRKEFDSRVTEASIMKQCIEKMERELEESHAHSEKEFSRSEELTGTLKVIRTKNKELEEKLTQTKDRLTIVLTERDSLKEELASSESKASVMRLHLDDVKKELDICTSKLQEQVDANLVLMKKEHEANELREQLTSVVREGDTLREEFNSYMTEASIMKQCIEKMERELAESHAHSEKEFSRSEELTKTLEVIQTTNKKLEEKLTQTKDRLTIVLTERDSLKEELASSESKASVMKLHLDDVKKELDTCTSKLQEQIDANSALIKNKHNADELSEKMRLELTKEHESVKNLESEIARLETELSSFVRSKTVMTNEIFTLREDLETLREDGERLRETSDKECVNLRQRIAELTQESKTRMDEIRSLENNLEDTKLAKQRLNERVEVTSNTVAALEKRLVAAENAREAFKLEDKLKEEALSVVRAKLEQLGKEKIENELKLKEVIVNLQEVRTSQDQVLEAQVQALEEKSRRLADVERDLDDIKASLAEKTSELESEKSRITQVLEELDKLRNRSSEESSLVEELQCSLESERLKIRETTANFESLNNDMTEIEKMSKVLKLELNYLWDSVREACPELARPKDDTPNTEACAASVVSSFIEDAKTIRKAVSILGEANETLKEHLDSEKNAAKQVSDEAKKRNLELDERLSSMESELEKRDRYLCLLANRNRNVQALLSRAISERGKVDNEFVHLIERWKLSYAEAQSFLSSVNSDSEELRRVRSNRDEIEELISTFTERRTCNSQALLDALCQIFVWSETKLQEALNVPLDAANEEFSPETILSEEIQGDEAMRKDLAEVSERINEFSDVLKICETTFKADVLKTSTSNEEKLQAQLDKLTKERKELKDKLDAARVRNAKMEKNMDELRNSNKKLKVELSEAMTGEEKAELERLRALTQKLEEEKEELSRRMNDKGDVDSRLATLHNEYGQKLEKIKQKMKTAYNEQIAKLNQEQEKVLKEKMESLRNQTELQCRKYTEDIAKYKAHISDLSSRYWDVGEKLLAETQEKQAALQQLQRLKGQQQHQEAIAEFGEQITQSRQKTSSLDRREFTTERPSRDSTARAGYRAVEVIEEETTTFSTRRHSVKSIQAMGNAFKAEDEEGEVFDSVYLADLKEGRCAPVGPDFNRLSELRMRNSMCRPHLKSSYAVETHLQPVALNEDDIKNGVTGDDVFNDSLSQSLLPEQKPKKKDRTQTSYKRPGPPTPSKNGGRLSLQGNELKSPKSRILTERNVDRRTTATPRGLRNLFGTSMSKRQDENTAVTPRGRRLSNIFRKQRTERN